MTIHRKLKLVALIGILVLQCVSIWTQVQRNRTLQRALDRFDASQHAH